MERMNIRDCRRDNNAANSCEGLIHVDWVDFFRLAALVEAARFSSRLGFDRLAEAGKSIPPVRQLNCRML